MEANIFTRFEFKFPFLFYHACFDWPESVKRATLEALEAARSPATCPVLCPGSSGTVLLPAPGGHGNLVEQRLASLAPQAAAAYFGDCSSRTPCGCCRRSCVAGSRGGGGIFSRRELPPMPIHPCVPQGRARRERKAPTHAEGGAYFPPGRAHLHEGALGLARPAPLPSRHARPLPSAWSQDWR